MTLNSLMTGVEETQARMLSSFYPKWHEQAKCLGMDDSVFFGASDPDTRPPYTLTDIRKARAICRECPVARECLESALETKEDYGVWAGSTSRERHLILDGVEAKKWTIEEAVRIYLNHLQGNIQQMRSLSLSITIGRSGLPITVLESSYSKTTVSA